MPSKTKTFISSGIIILLLSVVFCEMTYATGISEIDPKYGFRGDSAKQIIITLTDDKVKAIKKIAIIGEPKYLKIILPYKYDQNSKKVTFKLSIDRDADQCDIAFQLFAIDDDDKEIILEGTDKKFEILHQKEIQKINPSSVKAGEIVGVTFSNPYSEQDMFVFTPTTEIKIVPEEGVSVIQTKFIDKDNIIAFLNISSLASYGMRSFVFIDKNVKPTVLNTPLRVLAPGAAIHDYIFLRSSSTAKDGHAEIVKKLTPDETLIVQTREKALLKYKITAEDGTTRDERTVSTNRSSNNGLTYAFNVAGFRGGDEINLSLYRDGAAKDENIIVSNKIINVRPGPISLRTGPVYVNGLQEIRTPLLLFTRVLRWDKVKDEPWRPDWPDSSIGIGFGISSEKNPKYYFAGIQYEIWDLVDISYGYGVWEDENGKSKNSASYIGVTMDLRIFKMLFSNKPVQ